MSINLQVELYCQNCPNFNAEVEQTSLNGFGGTILNDTVIKCKNAAQCQSMFEFIRNQSDPRNFKY